MFCADYSRSQIRTEIEGVPGDDGGGGVEAKDLNLNGQEF